MKLFLYVCVVWLCVMGGRPMRAYGVDYREPEVRVVVDSSYRGEMVPQKVGGEIFIPAREMLNQFGGSLAWNPHTGALTIIYRGKPYHVRSKVIGNKAYVPSEYVSQIYGHYTEVFPETNVLAISTNGTHHSEMQVLDAIPSYRGYTKEDVYWLARLINAESKGEPYEGMIAVGNVVKNRKVSPAYPSTIYGVIFDSRNGTQFSPVSNGAINKTPSERSVVAAIEVLEGKNNAKDVLFFYNPNTASTSWIGRNREHAFTVVNHAFYY